jgi:FtsP/CotA-like multicopper oxidase with cupredoxin domain
MKRMPNRVGREYVKARLVEYTDANFATAKTRPNKELHLGILGPTLRAAVGDTIVVVFKNNVPTGMAQPMGRKADLGFSLHPHGVFYDRANEGAPYLNNVTLVATPTQQRRDLIEGRQISEKDMQEEHKRQALFRMEQKNARRAGVHPSTGGGSNIKFGQTWNYTWFVPDRAGPGPNEQSSKPWFYHSHVDEPADTNAALTGVIVVTRAEDANPDGTPKDVDREFVTIFSITDEISSPFALENTMNLGVLQNNMSKYMALSMDMMFQDSQRMKNINGYMYANLPGLYAFEKDRIRWYVGTLGDERDVHGAHWHGNVLTVNNQRLDSMGLVPGMLFSADMYADNAGQWLFHCHTNHHIHGGMIAHYEILACPSCPNKTPSGAKCPTTADCVSACGAGNVATCECPSNVPKITCKATDSASEGETSASVAVSPLSALAALSVLAVLSAPFLLF